MSLQCLQFPPKNERKQFDLRFHSSKVKFVCSFFGGNISLKKSFRLCLTFRRSTIFFYLICILKFFFVLPNFIVLQRVSTLGQVRLHCADWENQQLVYHVELNINEVQTFTPLCFLYLVQTHLIFFYAIMNQKYSTGCTKYDRAGGTQGDRVPKGDLRQGLLS